MKLRVLLCLLVASCLGGVGAGAAHADPCTDVGGTTEGNLCRWDGTYGNSNYPGSTPAPLPAKVYRRIYTTPGGATVDGQTNKKVIIFLHGGGWTSGGGNYTNWINWAKWAANEGYVGITAEYFLAPSTTVDTANTEIRPAGLSQYPGCGGTPCYRPIVEEAMRNVQTAVRYVKANASALGIDPTQIYVMGESAGGTNAFNVATRSDEAGNPSYAGGAAADLAVRGNASQSSAVAGAFPVAGAGCYPTWTDSIGGGIYAVEFNLRIGSCPLNSSLSSNEKVVIFQGLNDGYVSPQVSKDACAYQSTLTGGSYTTTCEVRYYQSYYEILGLQNTSFETWYGNQVWQQGANASRTHSDTSQGLCYRPSVTDGLERKPGADHFIAQTACPSRAGITGTGDRSPGYGAGQVISTSGTWAPLTSKTIAKQVADAVGTP